MYGNPHFLYSTKEQTAVNLKKQALHNSFVLILMMRVDCENHFQYSYASQKNSGSNTWSEM
jgi:hypothetical protein